MFSLDTKHLATIVIFLGYLVYEVFILIAPPTLPNDIQYDMQWGNNQQNNNIIPFTIDVKDEVITDLNRRLENSRLVAPYYEGSSNKYGTNLLLLKDVIRFWRYDYNWTERQRYLNKYPQYKTNIQGLNIHFIHLKPKVSNPKKQTRPLLLLHGWPGSVREFYDILDIFQNGTDSFNLELVVPSLPGYGFSEAPSKPGLSLTSTAIIMKKLMTRLGYKTFYVQGGDLGGIILQILSVLYPESVLGLHTNFPVVYTIKSYLKPILSYIWPSWVVKPEHYDRVYPLAERGLFIYKESGYIHLQSTKPDSIGVALDDTPMGLAGYFLEKFLTGKNFSWINDFDWATQGKELSYIGFIDNIMYYWVTGSVTTAFRIYYETFTDAMWTQSFTILRIPVKVPTIIYRSKHDLYMPDGVLGELFPLLVDLSDHDTGHFPAFSNSLEFSQEVLRSIEKFEDYRFRMDYYKLHRSFPYK